MFTMEYASLFEAPISYYVFLITCLASLPAFYIYLTWNYDYWKKRGVPGNKPRLFMGTFTPPWIRSINEQDMECFRKYGRTHGGFEGRRPVLYTTDPEIIRLVTVKDFSAFPNRRSLPGTRKNKYAREMMSVLNDDEWKALRNVMTPAYTSGKLKHMVHLVEDCVRDFIQSAEVKAENDDTFELTDCFSVLTLEIIASCAFGVKIDDVQKRNSEFVNRAKKVFRPAPVFMYLTMIMPALFDKFPSWLLPDPFSYFADVANKTVDMKLESDQPKRKDFLDILLDAEISDDSKVKKKLTRDSIVAQTILFLLAGNETTAVVLSHIAFELAQNPTVQEKLIAEVDAAMNECDGKLTYEIVAGMQYLDMIINETFRHEIPVFRLERICEKDGYKINGITLDRGVMVSIPVFPLYNDPEFFPDPDVFDPERFSPENKAKRNQFTFIPFGAGPRNCIAMRFALLELKITLIHLLSKFRFHTWEKTEIPLKYLTGPFLRQPVSVNLKLTKMRSDQSFDFVNAIDD